MQASLFALQQGTVSASLAGSGSLTKTGPGLVTLTGSNGYTGSTTLSSGQLSLAGAGAIWTVVFVAVAQGWWSP